MKKIKVYNIEKLIENEIQDKKLLGYSFGLAIVEGSNGLFAFDNEGVGWEHKTIDAEITLGLTDIPKENEFFIMPQYEIKMSIKDLKEAEYEEMLLTEFIDRYNYNDRLRRNFSTVLEVINNIGLNSREYYK